MSPAEAHRIAALLHFRNAAIRDLSSHFLSAVGRLGSATAPERSPLDLCYSIGTARGLAAPVRSGSKERSMAYQGDDRSGGDRWRDREQGGRYGERGSQRDL